MEIEWSKIGTNREQKGWFLGHGGRKKAFRLDMWRGFCTFEA